MASTPQVKVSFRFHIAGTTEIAVTDLTIGDLDGPVDQTGLTFMSGVCRDAMQDFLDDDGVKAQRASYSVFDGVSLAYQESGAPGGGVGWHQVGDTVQAVADGSHLGGSPYVVPQATIVLTTRSADNLGKGNYGRMYIPHSGVPTGAAGPRLPQSTVAVFGDAGRAMLNAINDGVGPGSPGARLIIPTLVPGLAPKAITRLAVGDVVDTQRRRRDALQETYIIGDLGQ